MLATAGVATLGVIAYSAYNYFKKEDSPPKESKEDLLEKQSEAELELIDNFGQLTKSLDNIYDPDVEARLNQADKIKDLCEEAFEIYLKSNGDSKAFKNKIEEIQQTVNEAIQNRGPEAQA